MTNDIPPPSFTATTQDNSTLPPPTPNDAPPLNDKTTDNKISKTTVHLPHPCSLQVLPSPTDKWSATTHPIKGRIVGYHEYHIAYEHFYFHQDRVLLTKAFAVSTTASTVGDGGKPKGSTELDAICGSNCTMNDDEFKTFAHLVLGLRPGKRHGNKPSESSFLNMLLADLVTITNITAVFALDEPEERRNLARRLARFSLLLLGADVLTPKIIASVWGENEVVRRNLGGSRGDLAIIRRRLISLASVANNTLHLWLTTPFDGKAIIPPDTLQHLPTGVRNILQLVALPTAAVYVREPLPSGQDRINILQHNLRQKLHNHTFTDTIIGWYRDLLLGGNHSTASTGMENHIFEAYGLLHTPLL